MSIRQGGNILAASTNGHWDLLDYKWTDHLLNDVSWLRSDTFSWQPGSVYTPVYNHLNDDIDGKTLTSETVAGTTVQFYLADDGHKICPTTEEANVEAIYASTGVAWYYIIDTTNQRFKLPRDNSQTGRVLIKTLTSGNKWARIYADGWVEQGGRGTSASLLVPMADTNYTVLSTAIRGNFANSYDCSSVASLTTTGFSVGGINYSAQVWFVSGYANTDYLKNVSSQFTAQYKYLYFYVGNFSKKAIENTAGINAELFNEKVDVGHQVIAFQAPAAENNYTWYRKYADGWVEQGGQHVPGTSSDIDHTSNQITLPVTMADTHYSILTSQVANTGGTYYEHESLARRTSTTTISVCMYGQVTSSTTIQWQVSGMAA